MVSLIEGRKCRAASLTPEPDGIGGQLALGNPLLIDRMIFEQIIAFTHHFNKGLRSLGFGEIFTHYSARYIVRRGHCAELRCAVVVNQTVTVADAAVKIKFTAAEVLLNGLYNLCRFGC